MSTTTTAGETVRRATIPAPRPPADDTVVAEPVERQPEQREHTPRLPEPRYPWPEPWGSAKGERPRSEFWDVATASWHSRGPYPQD